MIATSPTSDYRNSHASRCVDIFAKSALIVFALIFLAPVLAQQTDPSIANFSVDISSDSIDVSNRHYTVMRYQSDQCQKPRKDARFFRKKFAKNSHSFKAKEISTGGTFFFQIEYLETRRREERTCKVLLGFQPEPNRAYKAVYETSGQVSRCSAKVLDMTSGEIEVTEVIKPELSCTKGKISSHKNSVPVYAIKSRF